MIGDGRVTIGDVSVVVVVGGGAVVVVVVGGGAVVVVVGGGAVVVVVVGGGAVVVVCGGAVVVVVVCRGLVVVVVVCRGFVVVVVVVAGGGKKKTGVVVVVVVGCLATVVVVPPAGASRIGKVTVSGAVWTLVDVELVVFFAAVFTVALVPVVAVVAGVPVVEVEDGGGSKGSCAVVEVVLPPPVCVADAPGSWMCGMARGVVPCRNATRLKATPAHTHTATRAIISARRFILRRRRPLMVFSNLPRQQNRHKVVMTTKGHYPIWREGSPGHATPVRPNRVRSWRPIGPFNSRARPGQQGQKSQKPQNPRLRERPAP